MGDFYRNRNDFTRAEDRDFKTWAYYYIQIDQPGRAESCLRKTFDMLEATFQPEHLRIATTQRRLASCLILLQDFEEVEKLLYKSLQLYQSQNDNVKIMYTANELISLYKKWGKTDKVTEYEI